MIGKDDGVPIYDKSENGYLVYVTVVSHISVKVDDPNDESEIEDAIESVLDLTGHEYDYDITCVEEYI